MQKFFPCQRLECFTLQEALPDLPGKATFTSFLDMWNSQLGCTEVISYHQGRILEQMSDDSCFSAWMCMVSFQNVVRDMDCITRYVYCMVLFCLYVYIVYKP